MLVMVKSLFGHSISVPTAAFVPWNEHMSAHEMKISYAIYRCSSVIHNLSFNQEDWVSCSMKLLAAANFAKIVTLATKAGSYGVCGKGESGTTDTSKLFFSSM